MQVLFLLFWYIQLTKESPAAKKKKNTYICRTYQGLNAILVEIVSLKKG
jgi:hypothetical protein